MSRPPSMHRWLLPALAVPLLLLTVLAALGVRAQRQAVWQAAREEARMQVGAAAQELEGRLVRAVQTAVLFSDPPVPAPPSPAADVLETGDPEALRRLRDAEDAGVSPAGLPLRVLAAFRVLEHSGAPADASALLAIATGEGASALTPLALRQVAPLLPADAAHGQQRWQDMETARSLARGRENTAPEGTWVADAYQAEWWLDDDDDRLRFLTPATLRALLAEASRSLPRWAGLRLAAGGRVRAGPAGTHEVMARAAFASQPGWELEFIALRPDILREQTRVQAWWAFALLALAVVVTAAAGGFIDRAWKRERKLNEMKSQFVASVSHELRAPVASIRLMADALEAGTVSGETVREFHRLIAREGTRLSTLVANVLDHARMEQGRKQWHLEPCDLAALTRDTLRVMQPLAAEKHLRFVPRIDPVEAHADADAIQQALINLLDNAIKFSPPGGAITVSLRAAGTRWELRVQDRGPGVPEAEHGRIFERFYRPGNELRRETQGTGIGLSLVKAIATAHGGSISLEPSPEPGSTFVFCAPAVIDAAEGPDEPQRNTPLIPP